LSGPGTAAASIEGDVEGLDEASALRMEEEHFRQLIRRFHSDASRSQSSGPPTARGGFGLALSGGGTRAAAFHCGVFWSLASAGLMKDVEHLCAVSGGGYTAASYITHICASEFPAVASSQELHAWYSQVVARFILRMQNNINYLVDVTPDRCCRRPREDLEAEAGSSGCPRWLDLPLFIGALIGSMTASPLLLLLQALWPGVLLIELLHGAMLRDIWCNPTVAPSKNQELIDWFFAGLGCVAALAGSALLLGAISMVGVREPTEDRHQCYLWLRSSRHVFERVALCSIVYAMVVPSILFMQTSSWGSAADGSTVGMAARAMCEAYASGPMECSDCHFWTGTPWQVATTAVSSAEGVGAPRPRGRDLLSALGYMLATIPFSGLALAGVGAWLWRSTLLKWLVTLAGPCGFLLLLVHVSRWAVFGPLTSQSLFPMTSWSQFSASYVIAWIWICGIGAMLTLPVYDAAQKLAHLYYRRSLKRAFFCGGQDISVSTIVSNPYCPNLLFGACLHDFRKPWEAPNYSDFTISSLFMGCGRTGFYGTPREASLARLMTVAGAATDATFLLQADVFAIRFFIAVVALRLGDFLRMQPVNRRVLRLEGRILSSFDGGRAQGFMTQRLVANSMTRDSHWISSWLQGLLDRLPAACFFMTAQCLVVLAATVGKQNPATNADACLAYRWLLVFAYLLVAVIIILSFFAYARPLQCLTRSPMVQQLLLVCMHRYKAMHPPPYLYISDGGLIEVLGILPLLRRRLTRIVVSDAAEDPELSMRCLRDTFTYCRKEGLCSFYDFSDPRRDMEFVLRDFRDGQSAHLHLGIRYEPGSRSSAVVHGDLFYVRMRLPPEDSAPVRPLLTQEELLCKPDSAALPRLPGVNGRVSVQGSGSSACDDPQQPLRRDLSGACLPVAECGGTCAGRRFPNFGVSNQFLTPVHFANLCGLGAELSWPLMELLQRCGSNSSSGPSGA